MASATSAAARDTVGVAAGTGQPLDDEALLRERTLFYAPPSGMASGTGALPSAADRPARSSEVRRREALAAPFVAEASLLADGGRCAATMRAGESAADVAQRRLRLREIVAVVPPRGAAPDSSVRYLLVRRGPDLGEGRSVVLPTGVVRITRTAPSFEGEVVAQFDVMTCADRVLPLELPDAEPAVRPVAVPNGAEGRVLWVEGDALLPTLQHRLIVDLGRAAGVRPGDQVTVFVDNGSVAGPTDAAIAVVVRATLHTASAVIIRQSRPGIAVGMSVRVTAKLP